MAHITTRLCLYNRSTLPTELMDYIQTHVVCLCPDPCESTIHNCICHINFQTCQASNHNCICYSVIYKYQGVFKIPVSQLKTFCQADDDKHMCLCERPTRTTRPSKVEGYNMLCRSDTHACTCPDDSCLAVNHRCCCRIDMDRCKVTTVHFCVCPTDGICLAQKHICQCPNVCPVTDPRHHNCLCETNPDICRLDNPDPHINSWGRDMDHAHICICRKSDSGVDSCRRRHKHDCVCDGSVHITECKADIDKHDVQCKTCRKKPRHCKYTRVGDKECRRREKRDGRKNIRKC